MSMIGKTWVTAMAGVGVLLSIGALTFIVFETNNESRLRDAATATQAQSSAKDTYTGTLRILARDTERSRLALRAITADKDVVALIQLLEDAGNIAGVKVSIDAVSSGVDEEVLQSVVVSMSANGSFNEVNHLLSLVEALPAASSITQFELERENATSQNWNVQIRVRFLIENEF